jgi:hypothetical protein
VSQSNLTQTQDSLSVWKAQNSELEKKLSRYTANYSIISEVCTLDERKSSIEKKIASRWLIDNQQRIESYHEQQQQRQLKELQDRILSLQEHLGCEPK